MPKPLIRLEDLPPREHAAWSRYAELKALAAQRRAEREAREAEATAKDANNGKP